jgi:hypothetical protein
MCVYAHITNFIFRSTIWGTGNIACLAEEEPPMARAVRRSQGDNRECSCYSDPILHGLQGITVYLCVLGLCSVLCYLTALMCKDPFAVIYDHKYLQSELGLKFPNVHFVMWASKNITTAQMLEYTMILIMLLHWFHFYCYYNFTLSYNKHLQLKLDAESLGILWRYATRSFS